MLTFMRLPLLCVCLLFLQETARPKKEHSPVPFAFICHLLRNNAISRH